MFKAVIFDRDGVIVDSESCNIESTAYALKQLGYTLTEADSEKIIGRHSDDYVHHFLAKHHFSVEQFQRLQLLKYRELMESAPIIEHVRKLILELHSKKIPIAITTSGSRPTTLKVLRRAGLDGLFDVIVTNEDYTHKKPHPEPYLVTAEKLSVQPTDCVVFEDTAIGVEAAKSAGMRCVAIPNEWTKKLDFSRADCVIRDADGITFELLKTI